MTAWIVAGLGGLTAGLLLTEHIADVRDRIRAQIDSVVTLHDFEHWELDK